MPESAKIKEARRNYNQIKTVRNQLGKKAFGKPSSSPAKKNYRVADKAYRAAGQALGRMTGKKSKKR